MLPITSFVVAVEIDTADLAPSPYSIREAFASRISAGVLPYNDILTCPIRQCFSSIFDLRLFRNMPQWRQAPTEARMSP